MREGGEEDRAGRKGEREVGGRGRDRGREREGGKLTIKPIAVRRRTLERTSTDILKHFFIIMFEKKRVNEREI